MRRTRIRTISTSCRKTYSNLTFKISFNEGKDGIEQLQKKLIHCIKLCDKGASICIMNTTDYLTKIYIHLQDHNTCKPLTPNPANTIAYDARTLIHYMHFRHVIDTANMKFALPYRNTSTPLFYGLSKNTTQTKLPSLPYCFRMWWFNWPSLILNHPLYPASC